ncbi:hypothetical protein OSB04_011977 [Centaurea solstitialis]|uniref:Uncharacterized protein n=1 Tax=Centaurea solstitialis TaxID=347529 RepID=A0AA38TV99_9ASTR|nr:hypothetical protein OSB04_011977 [Centaurea solstitialis]
MYSDDPPPSFSSAGINIGDQNVQPINTMMAAFHIQSSTGDVSRQLPSYGALGHGQGNSQNELLPDGVIHRGGIGQSQSTGNFDGDKAPSFTALGHGQGHSHNQDGNFNRSVGYDERYSDGVHAPSVENVRDVRRSHPSGGNGDRFISGDEAPSIGDFDKRERSGNGVASSGDGEGASLEALVGFSQQSSSGLRSFLEKQKHIEVVLTKHSEQSKIDYKIRLNASIDRVRFLLRQGLAFRGNYIELLQFLADHNKSIEAVTFKNAPENLKLTSPDIQKDIVNAAAAETTKLIVSDLGDDFFWILVDESHMKGDVIERFLAIEHVPNTTSISLKTAIDNVFSRHGLSISNLRGQGYDGDSNMQGELGGLKTLILNENPSAYYVHCFAHQLQLTLVAVAKKNLKIASLFFLLSNVVNVVGVHASVVTVFENNKLTKLSRHLVLVKSQVVEASIKNLPSSKRVTHIGDHIMELCIAKEGARYCNAMNLVGLCKKQLQNLRDNGWDSLLDHVPLFCEKHDIDVCQMEEMFLLPGRSRRKAPHITNSHYYRVELFYAVIDLQLMELEHHFSETSTELLVSMAILNPKNSFAAFDKNKLIRLARFYPKDFSEMELMILDDQLETYILDMQNSSDFSNLNEIGDLAHKMVETQRDKVFPSVYLLIRLVLTLPVATAIVERTFSAMNVVKNRLRNRMGDQWLNANLVTYIEKDVFAEVANEDIIDMFQKMKTRRVYC